MIVETKFYTKLVLTLWCYLQKWNQGSSCIYLFLFQWCFSSKIQYKDIVYVSQRIFEPLLDWVRAFCRASVRFCHDLKIRKDLKFEENFLMVTHKRVGSVKLQSITHLYRNIKGIGNYRVSILFFFTSHLSDYTVRQVKGENSMIT